MLKWSSNAGRGIWFGAVLATIGLVGNCLMNTAANASTITETYDFSLGGFVDVSSALPPPIPAFSGSFSVTLDPTQNYTNDTAGITVNYFNGPIVDSPIGFNYYAIGSAFPGWLFVGGTANGSNADDGGTNDFVIGLDISDPGSPRFLTCADKDISCGSATGNAAYDTAAYTTTTDPNSFWLAQATASEVAVPEPDSGPLFALGLGVLGVLGWHRRRRRAEA